MINLGLTTAKVNGKTRDDLLDALRELANVDADFNGENGVDYIWKEAKQAGDENNMEHVIRMVRNFQNDEDVIERFVQMWMDNDNYYKEHTVDVVYDEDKKAEFIAIAFAS